jgi:hypothetical protein
VILVISFVARISMNSIVATGLFIALSSAQQESESELIVSTTGNEKRRYSTEEADLNLDFNL